jgi:hypothetical protein
VQHTWAELDKLAPVDDVELGANSQQQNGKRLSGNWWRYNSRAPATYLFRIWMNS